MLEEANFTFGDITPIYIPSSIPATALRTRLSSPTHDKVLDAQHDTSSLVTWDAQHALRHRAYSIRHLIDSIRHLIDSLIENSDE